MNGNSPGDRPRARRPLRRVRLAGAFVLLAALLAFPSRAAALELGVVPDLNWGIPAEDQRRVASQVAALDARWVRIHVRWRDFEPARGVHNRWSLVHTKIAIDYARDAGAKVAVMVYDAPAWASGSEASNVPRRPADFAAFMRFLAAEYRGSVAAYEIWNEPNYQRFWSTGPNAAAYTTLLRAAYPAVKEADPRALVVFGGTSLNDYRFLEGAYAAGVKGSFDALATHPYTSCGASPDRIQRDASGRMTPDTFVAYRELFETMRAHGDEKPIWVTEFGWSTTTQRCRPQAGVWVSGVTPATQAKYLARAVTLFARDPYVKVAMVYNLRNNYWSRDKDELEAQYGLVQTNFKVKPAFTTFRRLAQRIHPPPPVRAASVDAPPRVRLQLPPPPTPVVRHVSLRAEASDKLRVERVEFYVGRRLVGIDRARPYRAVWRVPRKSAGRQFRLTAVAVDAGGRMASDTRAIRVLRPTRSGR